MARGLGEARGPINSPEKRRPSKATHLDADRSERRLDVRLGGLIVAADLKEHVDGSVPHLRRIKHGRSGSVPRRTGNDGDDHRGVRARKQRCEETKHVNRCMQKERTPPTLPLRLRLCFLGHLAHLDKRLRRIA